MPNSHKSEPFREMAARVDLNAEGDFSGAVVIVPPGEERPVEVLLLKNAGNSAMFWSLVKSLAEMAIADLARAEVEGQGYAFPMRR